MEPMRPVPPSSARALECLHLDVSQGGAPVLHDIGLAVEPGEVLGLLGPSGSGKTSLLYAVAGFLPIAGGEIRIAGRTASTPGREVPPEQRDVAMVFQHYALWPHMTALDTAAYPMRRRGMRPAEATGRALELLELMGVGHLAGRRPAELSGGEQQRVGVARALGREASLLLLDEPTAHLDPPLRTALMAELAAQRERTAAAAVYATHDVGEALAVASRVALLRDGVIVQVGAPREIYECPVDLWAARLTGPASVIAADLLGMGEGRATLRIRGTTVTVALAGPAFGAAFGAPGAESAQGAPAPASTLSGPGPSPHALGAAQILVRPDWSRVGGALPARVARVWYRGSHTDYRLETDAGALELRAPGPPSARVGEAVGWTLDRAWLLPPV